MPDRCCTLKISPLVRELILTLAERGGESTAAPATARLVQVLFDELPASRRSTCSCRYQTTRKFVKW